ncbi:MAG: 50S ribosomal protein L23 [candidate division TM6 bacterium GW2011_GWF2_43_17]|nr:MAG: 50S ribosomal protein L23 [candidate division TM6 bacterium GW2011_GWF2_43_17]HAU30142.1 50S ribosomal protein L23 [Candidatus Dependentiae bacterium]
MELNIYEIIRKPRVTIKAFDLNRDFQQLVLDVHPKANKSQIAEALERLFDVKVASVRVIVNKGRRRRSGRFIVEGNLRKKAVVSLKKGESVNLGVDAPVAPSIDSVQTKE